VRRRRAGERVGIAGVVLVAIGLTVMVSATVVGFTPDGTGQIAAMVTGGQATIIGVMLVCYAKLAERNLAANEAWKLAEDIGYEKGVEAASESRPRPVVVDLEARRCPACRTGKEARATHAAKLVDHV